MKVCVVHVVVSVTCFMELELYLLTSSLPGIGQTFQSRQTRDLRPTDKQKGTSVFCTYGRLAGSDRAPRPAPKREGFGMAWASNDCGCGWKRGKGRERRGEAREGCSTSLLSHLWAAWWMELLHVAYTKVRSKLP